ncbi:MAG: hypothetical protein Kow0097_11590 [Candidatus Bipolaricaulota bacterium]
MNPIALLVIVLVAAATLAVLWQRWGRRLAKGLAKVDTAWEELGKALAERISALETMLEALEEAGYVPEARPRLREAVANLRQAAGPRTLAAADRAVEGVLLHIYRGLPRERIEAIRQAQNRLAQADEEWDLARSSYNDLALSWALLARRFPYRHIVRRRGFVPPEPFLLPGEEADWARRRLA